jgi:hypothetical protein
VDSIVMASVQGAPKPNLYCNNNNNAKRYVFLKAEGVSSSSHSQNEFLAHLPPCLVATAAAIVMAMTATTTTSWNFVTPDAATASSTATTTTTIGRGGMGNGGGGGGGTGGPVLKTMYPHILAERRAQDDVRQWEEDTLNNPYEVRSYKS